MSTAASNVHIPLDLFEQKERLASRIVQTLDEHQAVIKDQDVNRLRDFKIELIRINKRLASLKLELEGELKLVEMTDDDSDADCHPPNNPRSESHPSSIWSFLSWIAVCFIVYYFLKIFIW